MKATGAALLAHCALGTTTLSLLVKLTRKDGLVLGVTDYDQDITYGGITYARTLSVNASEMVATAALDVDNFNVNGFLDVLGLDEGDIAAGLWDFCEVRTYRVNRADLTMGDEKLTRGWLGELSTEGNAFSNEVRSLTQKLQSRIVELVSETCAAELFDARCKVVKQEGVNQFSGSVVTAVTSPQRAFTCAALASAVDFFTNGYVVWTSGLNEGLAKEIKKDDGGGALHLTEAMPYAIEVGDECTVFAGCMKRFNEDCIAKHDNAENFRGYPQVPGNDAVLRGPQ